MLAMVVSLDFHLYKQTIHMTGSNHLTVMSCHTYTYYIIIKYVSLCRFIYKDSITFNLSLKDGAFANNLRTDRHIKR
jgi:hypothetical protein